MHCLRALIGHAGNLWYTEFFAGKLPMPTDGGAFPVDDPRYVLDVP
jgi:hypothetical protein